MGPQKSDEIRLLEPFGSSICLLVLQLLRTEFRRVSSLHIELHQELLEQNLQVRLEGWTAIGAKFGLILRRQSHAATAGSFPVLALFLFLVLRRDFATNLMALHVVFACSQNGRTAFTKVASDKVFKMLKQ